MSGDELIRCHCRNHRGKACMVAAGSELAAAASGGDQQAQRNRHNLLVQSEHGVATDSGPWPLSQSTRP
jgi:hypothetical protein